MEQLDLFSSGPKPEPPEKKEVKKPAEVIKVKDEGIVKREEINHTTDSTTRQAFIVPKSEPLETVDESVNTVETNIKKESVVFFEEVEAPKKEEVEEVLINETEIKPEKVTEAASTKFVKGKERIP